MLFFPQLIQFPASRRVIQRTVVNQHADGRRVKLADAAGRAVEWRLQLRGLTDAEWGTLESLFEAVEGRLKPFLFPDPLDNLLAWSEDLSQAAWVKDAGLVLTAGVVDPFGGTAATRVENAGAVSQTLAVPSDLRYCLSFHARGAAVTAFVGTAERTFAAGAGWRRCEHTAQLAGGAETVSFGVRLGGGSAELFGFQVEAQRGASAYKKTGARGGVYANAYFLEDELALTSEGLGEHSCAVRIRAAG